MHEIPVNPPPISKYALVGTGARLGLKVAVGLTILYIIGLMFIWFALSLISPSRWYNGDLQDFVGLVKSVGDSYLEFIIIAIFITILGGIPAAIIGVIGGGIIGDTFRFFKTRLSFKQAVGYGLFISLVLLIVRILLPYLLFPDALKGVPTLIETMQRDVRDLGWWLIWFVPTLIAFFGFWWVAYQLNEQMPIPSS